MLNFVVQALAVAGVVVLTSEVDERAEEPV
jgi:hypothetical protein